MARTRAKKKGRRSSNDAKPWKCRYCCQVNKPTEHTFFTLPAFECRRCQRKFDGDFKFCFGEVDADRKSLIGKVLDQGNTPYCIAYAYSKAIEIVDRVSCVNNGQDPDKVKPIDPIELQDIFEEKFPKNVFKESPNKDEGLHTVLHMGLLLREEGIPRVLSDDMRTIEDLVTIARDDFEEICRCLADGVPLVATYLPGKRRSTLRYCQIYKAPPSYRYKEKNAKKIGHAVVLIGAGMKEASRFFYAVSSWNTKYCPRKNIHGKIIRGGIGKVRERDLTKNVIKLSQTTKRDCSRRLESQNRYEISRHNYILMMGLKDQCASMLKCMKVPRSADSQCDHDDFTKLLEDHLIHGPYCNDEGGYPLAVEDRYEKLEASFLETRGSRAEKDVADELPQNEVPSVETDHTISLMHVVDPVASLLGNQDHSKKGEAFGFCYVNDIVLAIIDPTAVALGVEPDSKLPCHNYSDLHIQPRSVANLNTTKDLENRKNMILEHLSKIEHVPSSQFHDRPADPEAPEEFTIWRRRRIWTRDNLSAVDCGAEELMIQTQRIMIH